MNTQSPVSQNGSSTGSSRKDLIIWWSITAVLFALYFSIGILEVFVGVYLPYADQLSTIFAGSGVLIAVVAFIKTIISVGSKGRLIAALLALIIVGATSVYLVYFMHARREAVKIFEQAIQEQNETTWKAYEDNGFYSIAVPSDWREEKNDVGSELDKRVTGYTYGSYINLSCGTLSLAECDPFAPSNVNVSVFVYANKEHLNVDDYMKRYVYKDYPKPVRFSDGSISIKFEEVPATTFRQKGVHEISYFVGGNEGHRYYFVSPQYVYLILVDYNFSKNDIENGVGVAYQELSQRYEKIISQIINEAFHIPGQ